MQPEEHLARPRQARPGSPQEDHPDRPPQVHRHRAGTTLDATKTIIVWLRPAADARRARPGRARARDRGIGPASGSYEIERLVAFEDVHLKSPGKTMTARDVLDRRVRADGPGRRPGPGRDRRRGTGRRAGEPVAATDAATAAPAAEKPPEKPAEPDVTVRANMVWAQILRRPGAKPAAAGAGGLGAGRDGSQDEVRQVRLRGGVVFHQDPAPGKARGTDVTGEALDVLNLGDGKSRFKVRNIDPTGPESARPRPTRLIALGDEGGAEARGRGPAGRGHHRRVQGHRPGHRPRPVDRPRLGRRPAARSPAGPTPTC